MLCFLSGFLLSTSEHKQGPGDLPEISSQASATSHGQVVDCLGVWDLPYGSWTHSQFCLFLDRMHFHAVLLGRKLKPKHACHLVEMTAFPEPHHPSACWFYTCELHESPCLPLGTKRLFPYCEARNEDPRDTVISLLPGAGPARVEEKTPRVCRARENSGSLSGLTRLHTWILACLMWIGVQFCHLNSKPAAKIKQPCPLI